MNKLGLFLGIILVLAIICGVEGCTPVCNAPYMVVGMGCCLDQNNNSICDNDESTTATSGTSATSTKSGAVIDNLEAYTNKKVTLNGLTWTCYDFSSKVEPYPSWPCIKITNSSGNIIFLNASKNIEDLCSSEELIQGTGGTVIASGYKRNQNIGVTGYIRNNNGLYIDVTETSCKKTTLYGDLVDKCTKSFNDCKYISTQKFDMSISIIKTEKFNDVATANEFFTTWSAPTIFGTISDIQDIYGDFNPYKEKLQYPVVLIASKITGQAGQVPYVAVCSNDGTLTRTSKANLLCGS